MEVEWYFNERGVLFYIEKKDSKGKSILERYLHEMVFYLSEGTNTNTKTHEEYKSIVHKNRMYLDNRIENLALKSDSKTNKNNGKKKRTVKLPKNCKFNKNDIPTYLWYIHPSGSHGSRFFLKVDNISWKGTASKRVSVEYKLEEAKKYMRYLQKKHPRIFSEYSMNGDYNETGKELFDEYLEITKIIDPKSESSITDKNDRINNLSVNSTNQLLKKKTKYLSTLEKFLLARFDPEGGSNITGLMKEYQEMLSTASQTKNKNKNKIKSK